MTKKSVILGYAGIETLIQGISLLIMINCLESAGVTMLHIVALETPFRSDAELGIALVVALLGALFTTNLVASRIFDQHHNKGYYLIAAAAESALFFLVFFGLMYVLGASSVFSFQVTDIGAFILSSFIVLLITNLIWDTIITHEKETIKPTTFKLR